MLEPVRLPSLPLVLVFSEAQLSTAAVYSEFDRTVSSQAGSAGDASSAAGVEATGGGGPSVPAGGGMEFNARVSAHEAAWRALSDAWMDGQLGSDQVAAQAAGLLANDLQRASFGLLPSLVGDLRAIMEEGALGAAMSGSGPTLFGLAATRLRRGHAGREVGGEGVTSPSGDGRLTERAGGRTMKNHKSLPAAHGHSRPR